MTPAPRTRRRAQFDSMDYGSDCLGIITRTVRIGRDAGLEEQLRETWNGMELMLRCWRPEPDGVTWRQQRSGAIVVRASELPGLARAIDQALVAVRRAQERMR